MGFGRLAGGSSGDAEAGQLHGRAGTGAACVRERAASLDGARAILRGWAVRERKTHRLWRHRQLPHPQRGD